MLPSNLLRETKNIESAQLWRRTDIHPIFTISIYKPIKADISDTSVTIEERTAICFRTMIFLKCHNSSHIWKSKDPSHSCPIRPKRKWKFTCQNSSCTFNILACTRHKTENKTLFMKFKKVVTKRQTPEK